MTAGDFNSILHSNCGLEPGKLVLAGISGGPDSLTLLDLLSKNGQETVVAHFNHHLRPEADADADFVRQAAAGYGMTFFGGEGDVRELARAEKLTIEEAARKSRYRFLFETAGKIGAAAVAVGHNADDQVETILMHLLRGSGLAGLRGMPWRGLLPEFDANIPLLRPLLGMWREEILDYCREQGLSPVTDSSNFDSTYYRNRLRLELIPYLQQYNPRAKDVFWRTSQTLRGDYEIVEEAIREAESHVQTQAGEGYICWSRDHFNPLPVGLRRGLMRRLIAALRKNERDIDFETVERALSFISNPSRSYEIELALGLNLQIEKDKVILKEKGLLFGDPAWPQTGEAFVQLPVPGTALLSGGWVLRASLEEMTPDVLLSAETAGKMTGWLDYEKLQLPLNVRRTRPGDRMQPHGFEGHSIKVSDIWVNIKLPRGARKSWPLVCSGDEIAWLPGYRPGINYLLDENTSRAVKLELIKAG